MSNEPEKLNDSPEINVPECSEETTDMITAEAAVTGVYTGHAEYAEEPALEETVSEENLSEERLSEDTGNAAENSAEQETGDVPAETETTVNPKILAIRSALKTQEEERQMEETRSHIADKVKKYKTYKETGELPPEDTPEQPEKAQRPARKKKADASAAPKKKKSKKAKKKKNSLFPRRGDSPLEVIRKCVFMASSAIFIGCLCLIADYFWDNHQNSLLADSMMELYQEPTEEIPEDETQPTTEAMEGYEYYGFLPGAERLLEVNPDVTGWITIPGTEINYPLLQRRGQEDGNEYYLKRNIKLEDAHAGSIFLDYRNNFDYVEGGCKLEDNSDNLIIYGHNMHDYSMFGGLKHYINNADYYSEHPIVELNSNYRKYQYKIFGFIVVDVDDMTETRFDYWNVLDFADEQAFYDYVNEVKRRTIRLTEVDVEYGDELLTLSTCNSTFSNGRLVVFARKLRDGEDLYADTETSTANPNIKWPNSYYKWRKNTYDPDAEFIPYG